MVKYINQIFELFREKDVDTIKNMKSDSQKADIYCPNLKFFICCEHFEELTRKNIVKIWDEIVINAQQEDLCPIMIFKQNKGNTVMLFLQGSTVMMFLEDFLSKLYYVGDKNVAHKHNKQQGDTCD